MFMIEWTNCDGICQASCSNPIQPTPYDSMKTLCNGSVYLVHQPKECKPEVEIVFIHGLQLGGNFEKAYVTTWLARNADNCWPSTWLVGRSPEFCLSRMTPMH